MTKKKVSKKAVAKTEENALMAGGIDFTADAGSGMEGTDKESFAIPFLRVIQKMSPQVDEASADYLEEARPGMLLNTVTGKLYDGKQGCIFLPAAFQRRFLRWAPRGDERGFGGEYMPEAVAVMREQGEAVELEGRLYVAGEDGNVSETKSDKLVDTRSHFGILEDGSQVLLTLSSTQIRKSKLLMSMMTSAKVGTPNGAVTPPTWMNRIKITTVLESNDQGSWYGVKFTADGFLENVDLYNAGREFHEAIAAGEVKVVHAAEEGAPAPTSDKF